MSNILVITHSKDATVDYMINHLSALWHRLNVDQIDQYKIEVRDTGICFSGPGCNVKGDDIGAVYYRKVVLPNLSRYKPLYHQMMQREVMSLVEGLAETLGEMALSRPSILRKAENKVVQLQLAKQVGFAIPNSLITNSSSAASYFVKNKSIVKPLATGRILDSEKQLILQTNLVDPMLPIDDLSLSPAYFQEYVSKPKGEYRVTIVGREVFAVRIDSDHPVDWRKKGAINNYRTTKIPLQIQEQCFTLMDHLGIQFGAFDFIHNGENFIFLEVNPNGQWLWLEQHLNLPISRTIVDLLQRGGTYGHH